VGFDGVWSNTACGSSPSAAIALSSTPAARTPASVTIRGRRMPMRSHSCGSSLTAPKSSWICVM
jgi:hypothetical protein